MMPRIFASILLALATQSSSHLLEESPISDTVELASLPKLRSTKGRNTALVPDAPESFSLAQQVPLEETSHESWFSRLGNSFFQALLGLILIPFALALMWMNELRNARQESILQLGTSEVQSISSKSMEPDLHGQLVLLNDSDAKGQDTLADTRFPMVTLKGALRLRSTVEVYQWEEQKSEKKSKDSIGGGETTTTQYSYTKKWSKFQIDSGHFKQPGHRNTISIPGLKAGEQENVNETVKYGESYYLPKELVQQLSSWKDATSLVNGSLTYASHTFENQGGNQWFYSPLRNSPEVGDVRVRFEYVPDGPVSIMALQCGDKLHGDAATFLPYRLVSRGCCGTLSGDALKEALTVEGQKPPEQLYEEDACKTGPFYYLCCCCNLITAIFARAAPPQIYAAWHGHLTHDQCFSELHMFGKLLKWGIRILSWILLYAAVYALFEPLIVILDIIPFLGKYISSGTSFALGVVIFFITALLATVVISLAYLLYHPLIALICLAGVGLLVGTALGISRVL